MNLEDDMFAELFNNPLFLQYLSGAGSAISQGQPISAGLDPITQSTISAQNQHKLIQNFLGQMGGGGEGDTSKGMLAMFAKLMSGEAVPGASIKWGDKDGALSLKMPAFSGGQQDAQTNAVAGSQLPGGSGTNWNDPSQQAKLSPMLRAFNPFL